MSSNIPPSSQLSVGAANADETYAFSAPAPPSCPSGFVPASQFPGRAERYIAAPSLPPLPHLPPGGLTTPAQSAPASAAPIPAAAAPAAPAPAPPIPAPAPLPAPASAPAPPPPAPAPAPAAAPAPASASAAAAPPPPPPAAAPPGRYVHSICGADFASRENVRRHHCGRANRGGCWQRNGSRPIPWDDHPSCWSQSRVRQAQSVLWAQRPQRPREYVWVMESGQ